MAGGSPGGKSVGKVTIRVLPDTSDFKKELDAKLKVIEKRVHFTVNVDRAKIDRNKLKASIAAQLAGMEGMVVDVQARVEVSQLYKDIGKLRRELQKKLDEEKAKLQVIIDEREKEEINRKFEEIVRELERKGKIKLAIEATTAFTAARLAWLSRTRFVTLIPELSQKAVAKVATQLAALSGARVAFQWIDDILSFVGRLDKSLPKIGSITAGVGGLVDVLLSAISSTLALGSGLAALAPLLLVLPGLIIGTVAAIGIFAVAMFDASKQLKPLQDEMQELADIIQSGFWDEARDPIIDLVTNLMPQLRKAFDTVSRSLGRFTARFAEAFGRELADGRLNALFDSLAKSFDILSTGTDAFAGALVSLSAVAAKYAPRLAQWFVDIANQFDVWLEKVANDGRLDGWIEDGISALKDLGSVVKSVARIFRGLFRATQLAGSGGIAEFADNMERVADAIESPRFQLAAAAFFRGAEHGTEAIGDGLGRVGDMLYVLRDDFEHVLGTLGEIVGDFVGDVADSFATEDFGQGLRDFVDGLQGGFEKFDKYLPQISEGLSDLLSFAGALADSLGEPLGAAIAGLSEAFGPFLTFLQDEILPELGPALTTALEELTPKVKDFLEQVEPLVVALKDLVVVVLPPLTDLLGQLLDILGPSAGVTGGSLQAILDPTYWGALAGDMQSIEDFLDKAKNGEYGGAFDDIFTQADEWDKENPWFNEFVWGDPAMQDPELMRQKAEEQQEAFLEGWRHGWEQIETWWNETVVPWWTGVEQGWQDFWHNTRQAVIDGWAQFTEPWVNGWAQIENWWNTTVVPWWASVVAGWEKFWGDVKTNVETGWTNVQTFFETLPDKLYEIGRDILQGLIDGFNSMWTELTKAANKVGNFVVGKFNEIFKTHSPSKVMFGIGQDVGAGLALGIESTVPDVTAALNSLTSPTLNAFAPQLPDFGGGVGTTYQASFNLNPDPGIPLADQVFQASQRLKARTLVRSVA